MNTMRKAAFSIDGIDDATFEGYTDGQTWNGWDCPYFEKSEAERVLKASEANHYIWSYDARQDAFIVRNQDDPEDYAPEIFNAAIIHIEGVGEVTVYGIGAHSWTWERAVAVNVS